MLEIYQTVTRLNSSEVIDVATAALEHGGSYDGVDNQTLLTSNTRLHELFGAEHRRIELIVTNRVTDYLQTQLRQLEHRDHIAITVTGRGVDDKNPVLMLEFESSADTEMQKGYVRDMEAIVKIVKNAFPGLDVYGHNSEASIKYGNKSLKLHLWPRP